MHVRDSRCAISSFRMRRLIDLFVAGGVNGLTALGVTGEVARLTETERQTVLEAVNEHVNGRS